MRMGGKPRIQQLRTGRRFSRRSVQRAISLANCSKQTCADAIGWAVTDDR